MPDPSPGLVTNMILYGTDWDVSTWGVGKGPQNNLNKCVFKQLRNQAVLDGCSTLDLRANEREEFASQNSVGLCEKNFHCTM